VEDCQQYKKNYPYSPVKFDLVNDRIEPLPNMGDKAIKKTKLDEVLDSLKKFEAVIKKQAVFGCRHYPGRCDLRYGQGQRRHELAAFFRFWNKTPAGLKEVEPVLRSARSGPPVFYSLGPKLFSKKAAMAWLPSSVRLRVPVPTKVLWVRVGFSGTQVLLRHANQALRSWS